jgi:RNA polymerase sigma factor (sigma-70 family)
MLYYSDAELLQGLKQRDPQILNYLYKEFHPIAKSIVERNSGNREDTKDVLQDSIIVIYKKISAGDLDIKCSLKTFFYSVCRNIWNQRLDRKWRMVYQREMANEESEDYEQEFFKVDEEMLEKLRLFHHHFLKLPHDCQLILKLFMAKSPLKEIAKVVGLKDESYVKTRKYLCKNMLRKRIMIDPAFKNIFRND